MTEPINNPEMNEESEPRTPIEEFLYHQRRAIEETGKALEALLPEGFRTHGTNASKEFTKGFRVLVDAAMDELKKAKPAKSADSPADDADNGNGPSTTGKRKVQVPVE
ncbi:MAG: hypothetical protein RLP44_24840 [Aggregatilineales bacterium]